MKVSRRTFLKISAAGIVGASAAAAGIHKLWTTFKPGQDYSGNLPEYAGVVYATEKTTICPYCGVGCGQIVGVGADGKVLNIEGDPDHPINEGALCSKGSALYQVAVNDQRLTKPLYRAAGSDQWQEIDWDTAISEIATKIKNTRDDNWIEKEPLTDYVVNRTEAIANLGGAAIDNEECYLLSKMCRALGLVYLEHQARI